MPSIAQARALVVGISSYERVAALPATVTADARDLHAFLVDPASGGYEPDSVSLLLNEEATAAGIRNALRALVASTDSQSTVTLYLSCHGATIDHGPHAGAYLIPVDANADSEETLATSSISSVELVEIIGSWAARRVLVLFDCCHSGGIGSVKGVAQNSQQIPKPGLPTELFEKLMAGRGRVIMASSRATESSWVLPGAANSLFTQHLLAGLRGGVPSDDGFVRVFDLFDYVQPRVTGDKPEQHPVFKAELEENFPVALYRGGEKGTIEKDDDGFRYDAYVSHLDQAPDNEWVNTTLLPRLRAAGLRIAQSGDVEQPGVDRLVGIERGIVGCKRIVAVLSDAYLADGVAGFESGLAYFAGVLEGAYRLLPVRIDGLSEGRLPFRLRMLTSVDLRSGDEERRGFERLVEALKGALPVRAG